MSFRATHYACTLFTPITIPQKISAVAEHFGYSIELFNYSIEHFNYSIELFGEGDRFGGGSGGSGMIASALFVDKFSSGRDERERKKDEKEGDFVPRKGKIGEKGVFYPVGKKKFENYRRAKSVIMTRNKEEGKCEDDKKVGLE